MPQPPRPAGHQYLHLVDPYIPGAGSDQPAAEVPQMNTAASTHASAHSPTPTPNHISALLRHFTDLRDQTHGGAVTRTDKETHFIRAVELLAPVARQALEEINTSLMLATGTITATGV